MAGILKRFGGLLVQAFLILLGAASLLVFARDGFHFFMQDFFSGLLILSENILNAFFAFPPFHALIEALKASIAALLAQFGFPDIVVQPHWKQAFVLLWLGMYNYADATRDFGGRPATTVFRYGSAFLSALLGGLMAGTVHLAHIGVLLWPVFGVLLFVGLNALWRAFRAGRQRGEIIISAILLGATIGVAAWTLTFPQTSSFSNTSPSEGLKFQAIVLAAFAVWFLLAGSSGADRGAASPWFDNGGRRMGLRILSILSVAAVSAVLGQWAWNWSGRLGANSVRITATGESFRDCAEAFCPDLVVIPAGRLNAAIEVPSFALAQTEMTISQFAAFIESTGYRPSGVCWGLDSSGAFEFSTALNWRHPGFEQETSDHPVVCVTWWDAQAYARWLSLKTGVNYRLPSEAEWEYAARGGTRTLYFWGDDPEKACAFANVANDCDDHALYTAPAGSYDPNPFGLHDMTGNVWEWTEDCYPGRYDERQLTNGHPHALENCEIRVLGRGSWIGYPEGIRTLFYFWDFPTFRTNNLGFRLARTL